MLAHIAPLSAGALAPLLLALLGLLRQRRAAQLHMLGRHGGPGLAVVAAGWMLDARHALILGWVATLVANFVLLVVAVRTALAGRPAGGWHQRAGRGFHAGGPVLPQLDRDQSQRRLAGARRERPGVHGVSLDHGRSGLGPLLVPAGAVRGDGARPQLRPGDAHALAQRDRPDGGRPVLPARGRPEPLHRRDRDLHRQPVRAGEPAWPRRLQPRAVHLCRAAAPLRAADHRDGPARRGRFPAADAEHGGHARPGPACAADPRAAVAAGVAQHQPRPGTHRHHGHQLGGRRRHRRAGHQHEGAPRTGRGDRARHGTDRLDLSHPRRGVRPGGRADRRTAALDRSPRRRPDAVWLPGTAPACSAPAAAFSLSSGQWTLWRRASGAHSSARPC